MDAAGRVLFGREAETRALEELLAAQLGAQPGLEKVGAIFLGPAGIGKSALLGWVGSRCEAEGRLCVSVRVPGGSGLPPRYPLAQVLEKLVKYFARGQRPLPQPLEQTFQTLKGYPSSTLAPADLAQVASAIESAAGTVPVAILIDDYDLAPQASTELLMAALKAVETPIFFGATTRGPGQRQDSLSSPPVSSADLRLDSFELAGLDEDGTALLASNLLGGPILPSMARHMFMRTLGNPLYTHELVRTWRSQEALTKVGGYWAVSEDAVEYQPSSLQDMIHSRLQGLAQEELNVLRLLAHLGREAEFNEIQILAQLAASRLVSTLSSLTAADFIKSAISLPIKYGIAHPLIATAVVKSIDATSAAVLHGQIVAGLKQVRNCGHAVSHSEIAYHALRALSPASDKMALLAAAADEAERAGAHMEAASWYEALLAAYRTTGLAKKSPFEANCLIKQAQSTANFDPKASVAIFDEAAELSVEDHESLAGILVGRAYALRRTARFGEASKDLEHALVLVEHGSSRAQEICHGIAVLKAIRGNPKEAERELRELLRGPLDASLRRKVLGHLGHIAFCGGAMGKGLRLLHEALGDCFDEDYRAYLRANLAWIEVLVGDWRAASALFESGIAAASMTNDMWNLCSLLESSSKLHSWKGDLAKAFDLANSSLKVSSRLGNPADQIDALGALALAHLERGDCSSAAQALILLDQMERDSLEPRELSFTFLIGGEAFLLKDDVERAAAWHNRSRQHLSDARVWEEGVDRLEAQIELARGNTAKAIAILRPWLDTPSAVVFEHARVLEVAAHAIWISGDRRGAVQRAEEAAGVYERLGAQRRLQSMNEWLAEHRPSRRGRPRSNLPGGLTQRETEVLVHVAAGKTNRDIAKALTLSVGTVNKHLEHLIAKAGVSRRTELVAFASRLKDPD